MALKYHPDKNTNDPDAEKKFKDILNAYQYLNKIEEKKALSQRINKDPIFTKFQSQIYRLYLNGIYN